MKILWWQITRLNPLSVGDHRAHDEHIVDLEKRVDKLEHHRTSVAVRTEREEAAEDEINEVLNAPGPRATRTAEDLYGSEEEDHGI